MTTQASMDTVYTTPSSSEGAPTTDNIFKSNYQRSQNEQLLWKAWNEAMLQITRLNTQLQNLQSQIAIIKTSNLDPITTTPCTHTETIVYATDEEELATETEWIRTKNKKSKKRKLNEITKTPPGNIENTQITSKAKTSPKQSNRARRPPPIIVDGVAEYKQLYENVSSLSDKEFTIKLMNNKSFKINVSDGHDYAKVTKNFNAKGFQWHSYEDKETRPIRVMAKNLHHSCDAKDIVEWLQNKNFKAIDAVNKLKWKTKEPTDMFMLTFEASEDVKKIYEIQHIMGSKVIIEPIRRPKVIPQCKKCQAYGHTQRFCAKEPRCVKCAGKHLTAECEKAPTAKPKCVHCGDEHPANYRGCIVAKELQKLRNNKIAYKSQNANPTSIAESRTPEAQENRSAKRSTLQNGKTFANAVVGEGERDNQNNDLTNNTKVILEKILSKLDRLTEFNRHIENRLSLLEDTAANKCTITTRKK